MAKLSAAGSTGSDRAVAIAASGRVFITGNFNHRVRLGSTVLTSQGDADVFVAQLSDQGQWLWATSAGGTGQDQAGALTISSNDELLVAGHFAETVWYQPIGEHWQHRCVCGAAYAERQLAVGHGRLWRGCSRPP